MENGSIPEIDNIKFLDLVSLAMVNYMFESHIKYEYCILNLFKIEYCSN